MLLGTVSDDGVHILLRGDDHPCTAVGLHRKILGNGLQLEHQFGVLTDELANLVHQEDDAVVTVRLPVKPLLHVVGEILHRGTVAVLVAFGNNILIRLAGHFAVSFADLVVPQNEFRTTFGPRFARFFGKCLFERLELAIVVQILFEFRNVRRSAVVSTGLIEDADERVQQRRHAAFIGFLIDVEQDRCGRNGQNALQFTGKHGIGLLVRLGDERTDDGFPVQRLRLRLAVDQATRYIAQNMREHLEQV